MAAELPAPPRSGEALRDETVRDIVGALNAVVGFANVLAGDDGRVGPEQRARYAEHVREGARTLMRLVPAAVGVDAAPSPRTPGIARTRPSLAPVQEQPVSHAPSSADAAPSRAARVFVVDGDASARELVAAYLDARGYELHLLACSADALVRAQSAPPDIVILDAAADDALATARAFKERDEHLSVVFLVPIGDGGARLRALEAGAEQFVEKPVSRHELRARVKNLLILRRNQRELTAQNEQLRSLQAFKDEMAALMVHDLKSPLSAIAMNLEVALGGLPDDASSDDVRAALEDCRVASARLFRMIANLLDIARGEDGRLALRTAPVDMRQLMTKIAEDHATEAKLRRVNLTCDVKAHGWYELDGDLLGRVVENLIENGMRYTRPGGRLAIIAREHGEELELRVANDGPPIPPEARARIFEKYGQIHGGTTRVNRGLGLYFCRIAAEAHGGGIALVDEPGMTTCFAVRIARRAMG